MDGNDLRASDRNSSFEAAKWIAIVAMTCDHGGKIAFPSVFDETHAIGRLAFPLFAGIVGLRLAITPGSAANYLRLLVPWAVVSQPFYVIAGRDWFDGNILFTLALGVAATVLIDRCRLGLVAAVQLLAIGFLSIWTEYWLPGVAMIPALAWIGRKNDTLGVLSVGPLGLLANIALEWPPLVPVDLLALLTTPVLLATMPIARYLPRLPKQIFYLYYPLHLLALHLWDTHLP